MAIASSNASRQKRTSIVIDTRQDRILREYQSNTVACRHMSMLLSLKLGGIFSLRHLGWKYAELCNQFLNTLKSPELSCQTATQVTQFQ